ncbi:hypothetical protein chiPu_0015535 [Chiloscyllium punctatum]|uniref:Phosphatidylethanolamine-binding protein 4 n=1 Tax=Chiloscyllium punctatum TaxID=137246 RepID=A0A401T308_CHIPU|nr:hypothetical protein [Chiloscyllium punctatum]
MDLTCSQSAPTPTYLFTNRMAGVRGGGGGGTCPRPLAVGRRVRQFLAFGRCRASGEVVALTKLQYRGYNPAGDLFFFVLLNSPGQIMSMKWPVILLLVGLDIVYYQRVASLMNDEETMCIIEKMSDNSICRGELIVIYPDLGNAACTVIPRCRQFRRLLSKEWGEPRVKFVQANKDMKYILIMADPDAPSKENPKYRFWRHWLVTNILVSGV